MKNQLILGFQTSRDKPAWVWIRGFPMGFPMVFSFIRVSCSAVERHRHHSYLAATFKVQSLESIKGYASKLLSSR